MSLKAPVQPGEIRRSWLSKCYWWRFSEGCEAFSSDDWFCLAPWQLSPTGSNIKYQQSQFWYWKTIISNNVSLFFKMTPKPLKVLSTFGKHSKPNEYSDKIRKWQNLLKFFIWGETFVKEIVTLKGKGYQCYTLHCCILKCQFTKIDVGYCVSLFS